MCEGSIHVPHRMAQKIERLVVRKIPGMGNMKGYYPYEAAGNGKLVCCRGTIEAVLKTVRFEKGLPASLTERWAGKRNVKVTLQHRPYNDLVIFPNNNAVNLTCLMEGTRIDIGVPVAPRKPAGMKMVEGAMREALALPPDPKPEDEEHEAPKPAEPEREPAPAGDPPTAARRR